MAYTDYRNPYRTRGEEACELAPSHLTSRALVLEKGLYVLREREMTKASEDERRY